MCCPSRRDTWKEIFNIHKDSIVNSVTRDTYLFCYGNEIRDTCVRSTRRGVFIQHVHATYTLQRSGAVPCRHARKFQCISSFAVFSKYQGALVWTTCFSSRRRARALAIDPNKNENQRHGNFLRNFSGDFGAPNRMFRTFRSFQGSYCSLTLILSWSRTLYFQLFDTNFVMP